MKTLPKYTTRILIIAFVVLLFLIARWFVHLSWHTVHLLRLASQASSFTQGDIEDIKFDQVADLLQSTSTHLSAVESDMHVVYPLLRAIWGLPGVGPYARQLEPLLYFSDKLVKAGELIILPFDSFWTTDEVSIEQLSTPQRLFQVMVGGRSNFILASEALRRADSVRNQIEPRLLPRSIQPVFHQLSEYFPLLQQGVAIFPLLPELMGENQPASYLILAQNRDEIRATGGFISGIGIIRLEQGQIAYFDIGDSYQIDDFSKPYPTPPDPLKRLMLADYWVTRDANWSPDFPTAAQQVQSIYTLSTGSETQGVIAFDQYAVRSIVEVLGPITLPDAPESITAKNVETFMQQAWEPEPEEGVSTEWWTNRKNFMGSLGNSILDKIFRIQDPKKLMYLGRQVVDLVKSGHLLVYFNQAPAQGVLSQAGLDHRLRTGMGDFLMVVDTNFGFNKSDAVVERAVEYQVDLSDPKQPSAQVTLKYQHTIQEQVECVHFPSYGKGTYADLKTRCYWDYWRVYVPSDSSLINYQVEAVPGEWLLSGEDWPATVESYPGEAGTQVFAGVMVLPTGESEEIRLQIASSPEVVIIDPQGSLHYSLRVQKQPGMDYLPFHLQIRAPEGYKIMSATKNTELSPTPIWDWTGNISEDIEFRLTLIPWANNTR